MFFSSTLQNTTWPILRQLTNAFKTVLDANLSQKVVRTSWMRQCANSDSNENDSWSSLLPMKPKQRLVVYENIVDLNIDGCFSSLASRGDSTEKRIQISSLFGKIPNKRAYECKIETEVKRSPLSYSTQLEAYTKYTFSKSTFFGYKLMWSRGCMTLNERIDREPGNSTNGDHSILYGSWKPY